MAFIPQAVQTQKWQHPDNFISLVNIDEFGLGRGSLVEFDSRKSSHYSGWASQRGVRKISYDDERNSLECLLRSALEPFAFGSFGSSMDPY